MGTRSLGEKWTIGQERSTHGQDGNGLPQAEFMTGRNITAQRDPRFAIEPSPDSENLARHPTCANQYAQ
ncbi:hypothetical protein [Paraburkholderia sp. UYCP14C]|uniref:hypothetical protein n=1 Tax=Paraburkholderia sp. UYCP14C TaxID=2511130 RepID=UPI0010A95B44|nr:hypothetical protein [Paraburkholderia sp. UYCP14C]